MEQRAISVERVDNVGVLQIIIFVIRNFRNFHCSTTYLEQRKNLIGTLDLSTYLQVMSLFSKSKNRCAEVLGFPSKGGCNLGTPDVIIKEACRFSQQSFTSSADITLILNTKMKLWLLPYFMLILFHNLHQMNSSLEFYFSIKIQKACSPILMVKDESDKS